MENKNKNKEKETRILLETTRPEIWQESKEKLEKLGIPVEFKIVNVFNSREVRKNLIREFAEIYDKERKNWLRPLYEDLKKNWKKDLKYLFFGFALDWYTFSHYFSLLKKFVKNIAIICDSNLKIEKFEKIKREILQQGKELRFLEQTIIEYTKLNFSYFESLLKYLNQKILAQKEGEKIRQILREI